MSKLNKIVIIIIMLFIPIALFGFSYAEDDEDTEPKNYQEKLTQEEAGNSIAKFTENFYEEYKFLVKYGDENEVNMQAVLLGITGKNGMYNFSNRSFIIFVIKHCLYFDDFKNLEFDTVGDIKKGDILIIDSDKFAICVEGGFCIYMDNNNGMQKKKISTCNITSIKRIKESVTNSIKKGNVVEIFDGEYMDDYGKYYGTTEGQYTGSYNILSWLFDKILGFFDYLFGIISYVIRAPFVGWANIFENLIDATLKNLEGVKVEEIAGGSASATATGSPMQIEVTNKEDTKTVEQIDRKAISKPAANDKTRKKKDDPLLNRVNIEDVIFNNVPVLDVDIFDIDLQKYIDSGRYEDEAEAQSTSVSLIKKNIAIWYFSIRNAVVIIMLFLLIYLGIRLAVASTGEKQAQYKELIKAWFIGFIVIFLIHFFMILVIEVNNTLVGIMKEVLETEVSLSDPDSTSIYDTIRTRAYSLKLSEGVPGTIIYMVLIYFLVRFLFVYIKRYFAVNILALMGPIIGAKYAFDKIQKGKTSSLSNWMFDFALNVLLQSVHALLYIVFMLMALRFSATSIPGFILALVMLNFIFKAEDLFLKIFKFDSRASSLGEVRENKNYFLEAYKVTKGVGYLSKAIPAAGIGLVKNTSKYIGNIGLTGAQIITSGVNAGTWIGKNISAKAKHEEPVKYNPINVREKLGNAKDRVSAGITGKLDDALYKTFNVRSLKLGLGRMKLKDPEKYITIKAMLEKNKKLKKQVLKRHIGKGVKSVTAMAKLFGGIPMIIVDPKSGIPMMTTAIGDLKSMAKSEPYYGHKSRKKIRGKRGRVLGTVLFGASAIAFRGSRKQFKQLQKDRKEIRKNEEILGNLRQAEILKDTLLQEAMLLEAQKQIELEDMKESERTEEKMKFEKALNDTINKTLESVLEGKNIEAIIKDYMKQHKINKLQASDIEQLLKDFNLENIDKQIERLTDAEQEEINKLESKLESIKNKIQSAGENVELTEEDSTNMFGDFQEVKDEIAMRKNNIDIINKVKDKVSSNEDISNNMLYKNKLEQIIKDYQRDKGQNKGLEENDIDEIVAIFERSIQDSSGIYTTKESISNKFEESKKDKLDRKDATVAILDSILENGKEKNGKEKNGKEKNGTMYEQQLGIVSDLVREFHTLDQKNKVKFGNSSGFGSKQFFKQIGFENKKKK